MKDFNDDDIDNDAMAIILMSYLQDTTPPLNNWLVISTADGVYKKWEMKNKKNSGQCNVFLLVDDCIV